jgi:hypothetical protein
MRVQTLAEAFVEELDRRWVGRQVDGGVPPVVYHGTVLLSPPAEWPPRLRFECGGRPVRERRLREPDRVAAAGSPPAGLVAPARDLV